MYAVVETGGKQYRVTPGDKFRVEKLDAELGATVELDRVLLVADGEQVTVGAPLVA
ncbi:MAG TPA: 50S ribosomal protein L21, partial [Armatimonadota bacterium]|nr:50S ribosomal protein L21 [Armatimonadota bacterium]